MTLREIKKMPVYFDALDPRLPNRRGEPSSPFIRELGNYDWYVYQYTVDPDTARKIDEEKEFRQNLTGRSYTDSKKEDEAAFRAFLLKNYLGWAPYATGIPEEKAHSLIATLLKTFLSCDPGEAVYFSYSWSAVHVPEPYLISGIMGILDPINNEYFELVMGGND